MKVVSSEEKKSTLSFGNTGFEINNRPANRWGIDHIGYAVDNWNRGAMRAAA